VTYEGKTERIVGRTRAACGRLIEQVRGRALPEEQVSGDELTEFAGSALEGYAESLLEELLPVGPVSPVVDEAWVKRQFHDGLDRAGAGLREALSESRYRHAVAQVLQRKMFEAEGMLRRALKARTSDRAAAGAAS
jgi:hypothetical protein